MKVLFTKFTAQKESFSSAFFIFMKIAAWSEFITNKIDIGPKRRRILWARNMLLDIDLFAKPEMEVLDHLSELGYEIYFISGHSKHKPVFKNSKIRLLSIPAGNNSIPLRLHLVFAIVQFFTFPIYLLKVKPDFVIVDWDSLFGLMPSLPFYRLLRVKIILDVRSTPVSFERLHQKVGLRVYLFNLAFNASVSIAKRKLDGMTIITAMMKKEIATRFDIDPDWIGVWTSGVSTSLFRNENYVHDGRELGEKLALTGKFIIFYHGFFSQTRGLMDSINAMVMVKDRYPDVVLFLLGTGSVQTVCDMRKAIADNELQDRVILHEPVDYAEVPKYIAMCDVGIVPLLDLPQWRNQSPLKLLEYLAMKKVVILTDIPCHREIIGNNNCGIYLPSVSDTAITKSIEFVYRNRDKLEEWGASGRTIVEDKYTWARIAENLESYLRGLEKRSDLS